MFCLALSNKRSILVVCGNYNVSYSMLLGRVGHTRSFLRFFAILRHLHQHCRHLRGQCLHASCIIDQTAGHLSGIQRYKQKLIIEMSKSSKITVTHIGNCTNKAPHLAQLSVEMGTRSWPKRRHTGTKACPEVATTDSWIWWYDHVYCLVCLSMQSNNV